MMNGRRLTIGVVLSACIAPGTAMAGGFVLAENGFYIIDFLVIAYLIKKMAGGPLKNFLENRKNTITRELEEAKRLHEEASERLTEYEAKLNELEAERERIRAGFKAVAEQESARIMKDAEAQAARLVGDAANRIEQETARLQRALETEAVEMAMNMATTKLATALTDSKQKELVGDAIDSIESMTAGSVRLQ